MEDENDALLSVKQMKANLQATLQKSKVLGTVKAQIRQEFINGLNSVNRAEKSKASELDLSDRILYSCIFEVLSNRGMLNSISVFLAETGMDPKKSLISGTDVLPLIKYNQIAQTLRTLRDGKSLNQMEDVSLPTNLLEKKKITVLDVVMHYCTVNTDARREMSTQTESAGPTAREALEESLTALRKSFVASQQERGAADASTIQERMIAFQRDCERRVQSDVALQVAHIRETELTRVRLEEAAKARTEMDALRKRLELDYSRRLQALVDSESAMAKRISDQEQGAQRSLYEARQQMQREIDELRAREGASARKQDLEAQGVKMLELRLRESLSMIEAREADIARRERAAEERRVSAAEEARREALGRVQLELDALAAERTSLLLERQSCLDKQAAHSAVVEAAKETREQLRQAREELVAREEELDAFRRQQLRADLQRREDEDRIRKMVSQVDPAYASFSPAEQVVALIRQNAALEVRVASYSDADMLQQRLEECQQKFTAAEAQIRELRAQHEAEHKGHMQEQDALQRAVAAERSRASASAHKVEELRQLLKEKAAAMETLHRQLLQNTDGGARRSARPVSSAASGAFIRGGAGSNSDRKAVEFLRKSGRYSDEDREDPRRMEAAAASVLDSVLQRLASQQCLPAHPGYAAPTAPVAMAPLQAYPMPYVALPPPQQPQMQQQLYSEEQERVDALRRQEEVARRDQERRRAAGMAEALHKERMRAAELSAMVEQQKLDSQRLALQAERMRLESLELGRQQQQQLQDAATGAAAAAAAFSSRLGAVGKTAVRPPAGAPSARGTDAGDVHSARVSEASSVRTSASSSPVTAEGYAPTVPAPKAEPVPAPQRFTGRYDIAQWEVEESTSSENEGDREAGSVRSFSATDGVAKHAASARDESAAAERARGIAQQDSTDREQAAAQQRERDAADRREQERVAAAEVARAQVQAREKSDREAEAEAERERQAAEAKLAEDDRMRQAALDAEEEEERQRHAAQERDAEEERQRRAAEERRNKLQAEEQQRKADAEREQQEQLAEEARQREQEEQEETEQREREEAERKAAAEAERAAAAAEQQKRDEDAAAILEARAKVLARRKEKQRLDGGASILSNSLPSSLQTAAAGLTARSSAVADPVDEDSRGDSNASNSQQSYSYSATSLIRNNMQPGVSTSLDSAAGALRAQPSRNLFGNNPSFQSLQDSDSSSDGSGARMEVGDVSDEQEGDRSVW